MAQYPDGTIADGPNGPIVFRGGRWVPMGQPQATAIPLPTSPRQAQQDRRADSADARSANADARAASAERRANEAAERSAREWAATHNPDGSPKQIRALKALPDSAAKRYEDQVGSVASLDRAIGGFKDDFGGNLLGGLENDAQNLYSRIGTPGQAQWWADVTATDNTLRNALFGASLTAGEKAAYDKTTITPRMDPVQIRDNLTRRRKIAMDVLSRRTQFLKANGYDPQAIDALAGEYVGGGQTGNVFDQSFVAGGNPQQAAGFGASETVDQIPADMQEAHRKWVAANIGSPNFADAYVQFRQGMDAAKGLGSDPDAYRAWAVDAAKNARGNTTSADIAPIPRKMSSVEQLRNNAVNNPVGAAIAGVADAGGFGIPSALAGDQMRALGDEQPVSMALGQIVGSLGATGALGKGTSIGLDSLARGAPRLAAKARGASPFVKSLAGDTAYAGIYGANTGQDPLTSMAMGGAGSAAGQTVGKVLGKTIGGMNIPRQAAMLRGRGIPLTVSQQLGGFAKNMEDKLASAPFLGDIINARRAEGMEAFNLAALNDAGRPTGARVQSIGETGVSSLMDQIGNSYDQATAGVNVPLDNLFAQDLSRVRQSVGALPEDYAARALKAIDNRVSPIEQAGVMSGDAYQQGVRGIKGYRSAASQGAPGFEQDYRDVMSAAQDALTYQMQRGGGAPVVDGLGRADAAYRLAKTAQKASLAATNGPYGANVFTPAQLNNAAKATQAKFGGKRPFQRLGDAGQAVLPNKVPNSGTADRAAALLVPGALGGAAGYSQDGMAGAGAGSVGVLAALAALSTKTGQKALQKTLIDRGRGAKALGRKIDKRKGLLGTATLPFLVEGN